MKITSFFKLLLTSEALDWLLPITMTIILLPLNGLSQDPLTDSGNVEELVLTVSDLTDEGKYLKSALPEGKRGKGDCKSHKVKSDGKDEKVTSNDSPAELPEELKRSPLNNGDNVRTSQIFFNTEIYQNGGPQSSSKSVQQVGVYIRNLVKRHSEISGIGVPEILRMPESQRMNIFGKMIFGPEPHSDVQKYQTQNIVLVMDMITFLNPEDAFAYAQEKLKGASLDQKVDLLATYLTNLDGNYEYAMINNGPASGEDRWDRDLHSAMSRSIRFGEKIPAGVCRHMHQMAVRLAREIGFDEAFGVGFRTQEGGHRTMVLTHPDDPQKVIQLNYGRVTENNGVSGPAALSQNGSIPDTGIRFRVINGDDVMAIILPSELGGILNQVTGGDDSDLGQRYEDRSEIQQMGVKTPYGTFRIFAARTPMGNDASTEGVSYNTKIKFGSNFYGEYGAAVYQTERSTERGSLASTGAYARFTHGADVKIYESPRLVLRGFGELHGRVAKFSSQFTHHGASIPTGSEGNGDFNFDMQVGMSADYRVGDIWSRTTLINQSFLTEAHANNKRGTTYRAPTTSLDHDSYFNLNKNLRMRLGLGLTLYSLGTGNYGTYDADLELSHRESGTRVDIRTEGRLTGDTPFWLPQAEHRGSVRVNQLLGENLNIGIDAQHSFEVDGSYYYGLSLGGTFGGE